MLFHKTTRNDPKSLHTKLICPRVQLRFTVRNWIRKINILREFNQCDDIWCSRNSTGLLRSWSHRSGHRLLHLSFVPACPPSLRAVTAAAAHLHLSPRMPSMLCLALRSLSSCSFFSISSSSSSSSHLTPNFPRMMRLMELTAIVGENKSEN